MQCDNKGGLSNYELTDKQYTLCSKYDDDALLHKKCS